MNTLVITFRNRQYKLTALDSAGRGMLSRYYMFGQTDACIYKVAKEHPGNLKIEKL